MAKSPEIADVTPPSPACLAPPDCKPRHPRQESEVRVVLQRRQTAERTPDCDVPMYDVVPVPVPVAEPVIESAVLLQQVPIGPAGPIPAERQASSLLTMLKAVFTIGDDGGTDPAESHGETIIGSGDRAHHLSLVAGTGQPLLRAPRLPREPLVTPPAPKSRADCRRRCGKGGFCDPSSDLGCGGVHCGNPAMHETL